MIKRIQKGITLIELLIVIFVIITLGTFLVLYIINDSLEKADDAKELKVLEQVDGLVRLYYAENLEYPSAKGSFGQLDYSMHEPCRFIKGLLYIGYFHSATPDQYQLRDDYISQKELLGLLEVDTTFNSKNECSCDAWEDCDYADCFSCNPNFAMAYLVSQDKQNYKLFIKLNNKDLMKNDGGLYDEFYEIGSDLNLDNIEIEWQSSWR